MKTTDTVAISPLEWERFCKLEDAAVRNAALIKKLHKENERLKKQLERYNTSATVGKHGIWPHKPKGA